jgi:hypothetical protein
MTCDSFSIRLFAFSYCGSLERGEHYTQIGMIDSVDFPALHCIATAWEDDVLMMDDAVART